MTEDKTETAAAPWHERARAWRENVMGMSRQQLAPLIGISASRLSDIEAGKDRTSGAAIDAATMRRYELLAGALTLGVAFDFRAVSLSPVAGVALSVVGAAARPV